MPEPHYYAGILAPRVMLLPVFDDWEAAAEAQQRDLLARARSRHGSAEPAPEAKADIVGNGFGDDVRAPLRKGEKGKRFIELSDGRTFDTETRQYVDADGKPAAKAGGLSVEWQR